MKYGMSVGLDPGHIVLDGDPCPSPIFDPYLLRPNSWMKMPHGMEVGLAPRDLLDGDPGPSSRKRGWSPSPIFGPYTLWPNGWMDQDGTWHRGGPWPRPHCARWGPNFPPKKGAEPPQFRPMSIAAKWLKASRCHLVWR